MKIKPEIQKIMEEEEKRYEEKLKKELIQNWHNKLFINEEIKRAIWVIASKVKKEKGMFKANSLVEAMPSLKRNEAYSILEELSIHRILKREKLHPRELHYHVNINEGKDMLELALEEMTKDSLPKVVTDKKQKGDKT